MTNIEFVTTPTSHDLNVIREWLEDEERTEGQSFICNWKVIEDLFNNSMAFCLRINSKAVAFITWQEGVDYRVVELVVAAVKLELRRQGHGGELVRHTLSSLQQKGILAIVAECNPSNSEKFWRKHGFVDFPREYCTGGNRSGVEIFRALASYGRPFLPGSSLVEMELWHKSIHEAQANDIADIKIQLQIDKNGNFIDELVVPAMPDWKVRLTFQDGTKKFQKVKRIFTPSCFEDGFILGVPQLA